MEKIEDKKIYSEDIKLECKKKIAYESFDHIYPKGSGTDNSQNWWFNYKLYKLFPKVYLKVLDLGCAGGGFVRECINDGCFAVGLEGSDYSKRMKRAEWAVIPDFLFTCDITKEFSIKLRKNSSGVKFNIITAWEVLEHIEKKELDQLIKNIRNHLDEGGLFIASVANYSDKIGNIEYHRTQKNKKWWFKQFAKYGMYPRKDLYDYFNKQYIRGDYENDSSFHLIMCLDPKKSPKLPRRSFLQKMKDEIVDKWKGSLIQRFLLK